MPLPTVWLRPRGTAEYPRIVVKVHEEVGRRKDQAVVFIVWFSTKVTDDEPKRTVWSVGVAFVLRQRVGKEPAAGTYQGYLRGGDDRAAASANKDR
jgi:hypothetical protein